MGSARAPGGGRKPKPTALKVLAGNPGHRALNASEARPRVLMPKCPAVLQGEARSEWRRISRKLFAAGLLTELDGAALTAYCLAWGRLVDAEQKLREFGHVIKAPSGYLVPSPYLAIANKAQEQMVRILVEFGMTPASRSRIHVAGEVRNSEKSAEYERFFGEGRDAQSA